MVGHAGGSPWAIQVAAATAANTASLPFTGGAVDGSTTTSMGGVSTARRMPNERMVRSWTSPRSSTAMASLQTQPSAMWVAPMQYDLSTTSSRGSPQATWTRTATGRPSGATSTSAAAQLPSGDLTSALALLAPGDPTWPPRLAPGDPTSPPRLAP